MSFLGAAIFNALFYGLTTLMAVLGSVLLLGLGRFARFYARLWAGIMLGLLRVFCGIRPVVIGAEHLPPDGPVLIAAQHQSAFDTIIWMLLVPEPCYVLKRELTRIPIFGQILLHAGMIPIDRDGGAQALRGLLRAAAAAAARGDQIIIFPEGTRVAVGERVKLQPGIAALAAHLRLPVIPVATDSGRRWPRRSFRRIPGPIHVVIGEAIEAGTPRAALLERIDASWRTAERAMPGWRPHSTAQGG